MNDNTKYTEEFEEAYREYNKEVNGIKDLVSKEEYYNNEWQEELKGI